LYDVIVVDNNSSDRTREIAAGHSGVELLAETKQGSYAARNRGVTASTGEIIAFTDSDCAPAADWISNIVAALDPLRPGIVLGRVHYARETLLLSLLEAYESQKASFMASSDCDEICFGYTNNMAVTRMTFDAVGPFVEIDRGADTILVRRAVDSFSHDAVRYCPEVSVRHLEITGVSQWLAKIAIYGASQAHYGEISKARALTHAERLQVYKQTIREGDFSRTRMFLLGCLLGLEGLCFRFGRWRGKVARR
jgi:glycosyltransferase involved in cell wall biosynthesis